MTVSVWFVVSAASDTDPVATGLPLELKRMNSAIVLSAVITTSLSRASCLWSTVSVPSIVAIPAESVKISQPSAHVPPPGLQSVRFCDRQI